jgi:hypothetical protein
VSNRHIRTLITQLWGIHDNLERLEVILLELRNAYLSGGSHPPAEGSSFADALILIDDTEELALYARSNLRRAVFNTPEANGTEQEKGSSAK